MWFVCFFWFFFFVSVNGLAMTHQEKPEFHNELHEGMVSQPFSTVLTCGEENRQFENARLFWPMVMVLALGPVAFGSTPQEIGTSGPWTLP